MPREARGLHAENHLRSPRQFAPQLLHFSDCVLAGREPEPSGREGRADVRVIVAALESARTGRAVELEQHRPPVERPELVNALPPSPS